MGAVMCQRTPNFQVRLGSRRVREKIAQILVVNLKEGGMQCVLPSLQLQPLCLCHNHFEGAWNDATFLSATALHCVCLACTGLTVRKDAAPVSVDG